MAAGKSSVARLLASRFERGVHLEGDVFRRSIVGGREDMTPDPSPEALEQLRLRYRLAAAAADGYVQAGFSVTLEDVVAGPLLGDYRSMVRSRPCHVVVLLPSPEAVRAREAGRAAKGYGAWTSRSSTTASSAGRHASASGSTRQTSPPRRRSKRSWPGRARPRRLRARPDAVPPRALQRRSRISGDARAVTNRWGQTPPEIGVAKPADVAKTTFGSTDGIPLRLGSDPTGNRHACFSR